MGCRPEVRVVAQPVVGYTKVESYAGKQLPIVGRSFNQVSMTKKELERADLEYLKRKLSSEKGSTFSNARNFYFADYAVHLFYRLQAEESERIARELLDLKSRYKNICPSSGAFLGIHPCLLAQAAAMPSEPKASDSDGHSDAQADPSHFATDLWKVLKRPESELSEIAFMGSDQNQGPWTFFFGEVSQDKEPEWTESN